MHTKQFPLPLSIKINPLRLRHALLPLMLVALITGKTIAQGNQSILKKIELGFNTGPLFFLGDLGGNMGTGSYFIKDIDWKETKLGIGSYISFFPTSWVSMRFSYYHGTVGGNDRRSPNLTSNDILRFQRNLHFRSRIDELSFGLELYPFRFFSAKPNSIFNLLQPYVHTGAGIYRFNPQAMDIDGLWIDLKPLSLEGQGFNEYPKSKPYNLIQLNTQLGIGIRFYFNEYFYIGMEINYRNLFTDQIDNVSADYYINPTTFDSYLSFADAERAKRLYYQGLYDLGGLLPHQTNLKRGNPNNNDAYFGQSIQVGFKIYPRKDDRFKCPTTY
ncbi:MAG: hypothetical protein RIT05_653 [Bacteroidota bacterium]|jgi:Domain of unknown function (DUF6089)